MISRIFKSAPAPVRVLSICDDEGLRLSRELLLLRDGYQTESIASSTAITVSGVRSFDLALICRSVDRARAIALIEMLRRYHPGIQILCIAPLDSAGCVQHADLEVPPGPQPLLDAIRTLLQKRKAPRRPQYHSPQAV
jgi:DNA-binding NtrC family response regulator